MKPNLLFVKHKNFDARTVENDIQILNEKFSVTMREFNATNGINFFTAFILQFFYLLFNIYRFKVVFIWFGDYHSFLPVIFCKAFGKKSFICLGGYDAHWIIPNKPQNFKEKIRKFCVMKSVKYATMLFPVSKWLAGFLDNVVEKDKIVVAYCCVDPKRLEEDKEEIKKNWVLTVGGGGILYETKRKKLEFFIEIGNYFYNTYTEYDAKFILIGHDKNQETYDYLIQFVKSPNISIMPLINDTNQLKEYFNLSKVYCQFSEYEAFGIAVIEAMLNRTIPLVYNGGAMPEVIGDTGIIISKYDVATAANIIKSIIDGKYEDLRDKARKRVFDNFTIDKRKETLQKYV